LERVSNERRTPTGEIASQSLGTVNLRESLEIALVHIGIDLTTTFDQVKRRDSRMRESAGDDSAECAGCVVFC